VESLAEVLREGRARTRLQSPTGRELSQEEVGLLTGQTGSAIGNYERGARVPSTLVLSLLAKALPLERSPAELQALRKEALRQRKKMARRTGADEVDPTQREIAWLKNVCQTLSEQVEQLTAAVDHLEARSGG
jgi:transcriptional regulator with XRE-family HTH domain